MYTSFDGNGARFGDTSVLATTSDAARVTAYASDDADGARQTLVLVNKDTVAVTAAVRIAAPRALASLDRWELDGDSAIDSVAAVSPTVVNGFLVTLPPSSVTVLDAR